MVLQMGGPSSACMTANTRQNFLPRQRTSFTFITEGVTSDKRHLLVVEGEHLNLLSQTS